MDGMLTRDGFPLRQVIVNSEERIPLVHADLARQLVNRIVETNAIETIPEADQRLCRWIAFYTVAAQLTAEEQLECLKGSAFGDVYSLSVIPSLKHQPTEAIVRALSEVLQGNDEQAAFRILSTALYGGTEVSSALEAQILVCSARKCAMLRAVSFELAIEKDIATVRSAHVKSTWTAQDAENGPYESWYGSILLVEACAYGELSIDELLKRIDHETWFVAAARLGENFTKPMADCFIHHLGRAVKSLAEIPVPQADLTFSMTAPVPYPFLSVDETDRNAERFPKQKSLSEVLRGDYKFEETRDRLHKIADAFLENLKESDARVLLNRIRIEDLERLIATVPSIMTDLVSIIEQSDMSQLIWLKNLAFVVGNLVSPEQPDKAASILQRALASQSFVTQSLGDGLTLEHAAIWGAARSEALEILWRERIFRAENDETLSREVLAAERFGADGFIRDLVFKLAESTDSLDHAYAVTIAGYSCQKIEFTELTQGYVNSIGLSGDAAKVARASHLDAEWAEKWVGEMWDAKTAEEFWRCLTIAKTCMDARVPNEPKAGTLWTQYAPVFQRARKAAMKDRSKERAKRLIGLDVPDAVFISM